MIKRIWNGYTTAGNADSYEHLLDTPLRVCMRSSRE